MKRYVTIQEHNAMKAGLHWDLRISYEETPSEQMSWVIPRHTYPDEDKLLAIQVDDHPWSYRNFEGEIKSGYGKGTVKLVFSDWVDVKKFEEKKITFSLNGNTFSIVKGYGNKWFWIKKQEKSRLVWKHDLCYR